MTLDQARKISREELFDLVWQKPMTKLASEYGLSDVGLGKICKKMEIPKPGLGHWTKIQAGAKIKKPQLKPLKDTRYQTVTLNKIPVEEIVEDISKSSSCYMASQRKTLMKRYGLNGQKTMLRKIILFSRNQYYS